ncbi:MAG: ATP-binding protein [Planctomycetota bacterium]|jgi:signal transduction histidine kinase
MAKNEIKMRSHSGLGMKFLLAIGLFSTAFSLFLVYQTWKSSHESLYQMLSQQAELAMAFEIAFEEIGSDSDTKTLDSSLLTEEESARRFKTIERVFEKVQSTYPQVIIRASGDQLSKILSRSGPEGLRVYRTFESNPTLETLDRVINFNDRSYLTKFRMERNDISLTDPRSELRMIAIPLEGYQSQVNEQTMSRFSILSFALLGLFGSIYCSFELLVGRPLKKIAAYFCRATDQQQNVCFTPLQTRSQDEIGLLARSFNRLGGKLEDLYETLDAKVRKRTFELQQVNKRLSHKISECQQAEENSRVLAHEAAAANRAKSNFLANMSHELRTPMNAIMGFSQMLSEENLKQEHQSYINMIASNSENLLDLINDILDYSKIESGKMEIETCDCRIGGMLTEIESMLRPSAIRKNIRFEILQCDPIPEVIRTDPLRLRQCLLNLITNAIKFTETGHVYVNITVEYHDGDACIRFDVEDTGIGVSQEKLPLIFDSFTQADSATTRKYGGTGLGLAITRQLVELLGGSISVVSTEGQGSVFTIVTPAGIQWPDKDTPVWNKYLPVDEINEMHETEKGTAMYNGKVLVAEDNPSNQKLIAILLQKMGLEVTLVDDGAEAVEKCDLESFDVILMDMQMPNLNGYDATRQLRSQGVKTPIIAVTANAMNGDEQKCMDVGCDGYLAKPIDRNKLDELVGQHLAVQVG